MYSSNHFSLNSRDVKKFMAVSIMLLSASILIMMPEFAYAAGGLARAQSGLEKFQKAIMPVLRIGCIVAFILAGMGYLAGFLDKSWFVNAIVGIIIIGSANEIVDLLWG